MPSLEGKPTESRLLTLPAELRYSIYRLILRSDESIDPLTIAARTHTALLKVNKQIRSEATSIYYAENSFALTITASNTNKIARWLHHLGPKINKLIPALSVAFEKCAKAEKYQDIHDHLCWTMKVGLDQRNMLLDVFEIVFNNYGELGRGLARELVDAGREPERIDVRDPKSRWAELRCVRQLRGVCGGVAKGGADEEG